MSNPKIILDWSAEGIEIVELVENGNRSVWLNHYERDNETNGWDVVREVEFNSVIDALKYAVEFSQAQE